jgi:hypothetical protein
MTHVASSKLVAAIVTAVIAAIGSLGYIAGKHSGKSYADGVTHGQHVAQSVAPWGCNTRVVFATVTDANWYVASTLNDDSAISKPFVNEAQADQYRDQILSRLQCG